MAGLSTTLASVEIRNRASRMHRDTENPYCERYHHIDFSRNGKGELPICGWRSCRGQIHISHSIGHPIDRTATNEEKDHNAADWRCCPRFRGRHDRRAHSLPRLDREFLGCSRIPRILPPVCTTELGYIARIKPEFDKRNTKIVGLSVDPVDSHAKWAADIKETQGFAPNCPMLGDAGLAISKAWDMSPASVSGDATKRGAADNQTVRNHRAGEADQADTCVADDRPTQFRRGLAGARLATAYGGEALLRFDPSHGLMRRRLMVVSASAT